MGTSINIITINAGSSSIKLGLFTALTSEDKLVRVLESGISGIGQANVVSYVQPAGETRRSRRINTSHEVAVEMLLDEILEACGGEIAAVGHRIVYGGPNYSQPQRIEASMEQELQQLASLDPEHMPQALELIATIRRRLPGTAQFACFDTSFFHDLPTLAKLLPLPRSYSEKGMRRYGFHGLSYQYLQATFYNIAGQAAGDGRVIYAHLGSGSSLAATRGGRPVDTTMSVTPASGLIMSTRTGDLDPNLAWHLNQRDGLTIDEFHHMVNFESGLLGISGLSADMYTLLQSEAENPHAAEAVELFCYRVRQAIGGLATTIGGLDSLIFSGGIGEGSSVIRTRICDGLDFLGITLDEDMNQQSASLISASDSRVGIHVIPTDEAQVIAQQVVGQLAEQEIEKLA